MRVKLQYSVELEEVPDVAADLIQDEADRLSYCDHAIQSIVESLKQEEPHISFVIDKIDKVRQSLGVVDLRLSEMENLLSGYAQASQPQPVAQREFADNKPQAAPAAPKSILIQVPIIMKHRMPYQMTPPETSNSTENKINVLLS